MAVPAWFALAGTSPAVEQAKVTVTVTDLRNANGIVRACMTRDETKFPKCRGVAGAYAATAEAHAGSVTFTFTGVKPGKYAIALLHDENGNGKADRALGMMPKEGFGFSRDAKVQMGPPSFSDAVFPVGAADQKLTIRMRYLL
ncbi:DUF2141 domain-containing protein [Qipengyuania sp. XHP0207]|uniref:DUF2141 domain-containing protein n=1 Tax=Qipengyuania sp. XHP0207 TaxID=3038078 RepID=UPI0024200C06|nr:DUF2141 domain-containing protein [Qipengyuania sp. XHP0207]MDG5748003.1 DUF2141 domain-containing protein [Qipengyuania sp. XHP0207]